MKNQQENLYEDDYPVNISLKNWSRKKYQGQSPQLSPWNGLKHLILGSS